MTAVERAPSLFLLAISIRRELQPEDTLAKSYEAIVTSVMVGYGTCFPLAKLTDAFLYKPRTTIVAWLLPPLLSSPSPRQRHCIAIAPLPSSLHRPFAARRPVGLRGGGSLPLPISTYYGTIERIHSVMRALSTVSTHISTSPAKRVVVLSSSHLDRRKGKRCNCCNRQTFPQPFISSLTRHAKCSSGQSARQEVRDNNVSSYGKTIRRRMDDQPRITFHCVDAIAGA